MHGCSVFDSVIAIIGDSAVPPISLIHSRVSEKYTFLFTEEQGANADLLQEYCKNDFPDMGVEMKAMPSISDSSGVILFARELMSNIEGEVGIFLTSGAKQTILPFLIHKPSSPTITLLHSPLRLVIHQEGEPLDPIPVTPSLEGILASRGFDLKTGGKAHELRGKDGFGFKGISARFDRGAGRLSFTGISFLRRTGREHEIHQLSKDMKGKAKGEDAVTIGKLVQLTRYFGRNGAVYTIQGEMRAPNKSVLPYFIKYEPTSDRSEEE